MTLVYISIAVFVILCVLFIFNSKYNHTRSNEQIQSLSEIPDPIVQESLSINESKPTVKRKKKTKEHFEKLQSTKSVDRKYLYPDKYAKPNSSGFYHKKVVFTGDLNSFSRNELANKLWLLGADIDTSLSQKTDIVIMGDEPGYVKMQDILRIQKEGSPLKIIYESDLISILDQVDEEIISYNPFYKKQIAIIGDFEFCTIDKVTEFLTFQNANIVDISNSEVDAIVFGSMTDENEKQKAITSINKTKYSIINEDELLPYIQNFN